MQKKNELQHFGIPGMRWGHRRARPTKETVSTANKILNNQKGFGSKATEEALRRIGIDAKGKQIKDFNPASPKEVAAAKRFVEKYNSEKYSSFSTPQRTSRGKKILKGALIVVGSVIAVNFVADKVAWATGMYK